MYTEITISVRNLVEFLLRSGNLDNRTAGAPSDAMLEGSRMHRQIQKSAGEGYQAEVPLKIAWQFDKRVDGERQGQAGRLPDKEGGAAPAKPYLDDATVIVEGRADGIYYGSIPQRFREGDAECAWTVDEIKTTYRKLRGMRKPEPVHLAQAKCYAYMYAAIHDLDHINIRMTYVNLFSGTIRYFYEAHTMDSLRAFFSSLMEEYRKWAEYMFMWQLRRTKSIRDLAFPFPYRKGQKELAADVYRTIVHGRKLFLEAPTGTGKTITTLFPAIKAMGEGKAEKIFYLTAKTVTRAGTAGTIELLRSKGLLFKSIVLTAKDKICVLDKPDCNPDACPRAQGHFDRVNEAMFDLLTTTDNYSREKIEKCAEKHQVCPFELSLDMSLFADAVIGDYNYVFDPHVKLKRFFTEGKKRDYLFLIDEAHNLVERGRDMFSASVVKEDLLSVRRLVTGIYPSLEKKLSKANKVMLEYRKRTEEADGFLVMPEIDRLSDAVRELDLELGNILAQERIQQQNGQARQDPLRQRKKAVHDDLLNFYFQMDHFVLILDKRDRHYMTYAFFEDDGQQDGKQSGTRGKFIVRMFCVDPGKNLKECMDQGRATILFSATFLPIQYYKKLLGGTPEDYEVYAGSVFDPQKRALFVIKDVTSRYKERSPRQYEKIADCIHYFTGQRHGNYMIFFPSYQFMKSVADIFERKYLGIAPQEENAVIPAAGKRSGLFGGAPVFESTQYTQLTLAGLFPDHSVPAADISCIRQRSSMNELQREQFLSMFQEPRSDRSLLGFCILGGIFSEGIDLRGDSLIGAMIVGTGLPQVSPERELLRKYFDGAGESGFDFAYRFPGMNKVLQAAGRVIRTADDVGAVGLLDERFVTPAYRRLFPLEWDNARETTSAELPELLEKFWNEWL